MVAAAGTLGLKGTYSLGKDLRNGRADRARPEGEGRGREAQSLVTRGASHQRKIQDDAGI